MAVRADDGISPALLQAIHQSVLSSSDGAGSKATSQQQRVVLTADDGRQYVVDTSDVNDQRQPYVTVVTSDGRRHLVVNSSSSDVVTTTTTSSIDSAVTPDENASITSSNVVVMKDTDAEVVVAASEYESDRQHDQPVYEYDSSRQDYSSESDHLVLYNQNDEGLRARDPNSRNVRVQGADGTVYVLASDGTAETADGLVQIVVPDGESERTAEAGEQRYVAPRADTDTEWSTYVSQFAEKGPCPICGDKISGYHYGVFSCESCKGFFKRSIQNGKSFSCNKQGSCTVALHNRKKCAACRFAKCLAVGMKLDAVRNDRSRGGRSVYDGCSPRLPKLSKSPTSTPKQAGEAPQTVRTLTYNTPAKKAKTDVSNSQLLAMLSQGRQVKATVPQLVTDIMNLESLLCEDDDEEIGVTETDDNLYTCLLQIADQRLYKIVRWARSLPHFAAISTDDQIALLQNAWAEILCLDCCWRSLQTPNEIKLSYTRSIDSATAQQLNVTDIYERVLQLRDHLQRVQMDMHEFACLKVLILMSPDIKGLRDHARVRDYQENISDALSIYTTTHYPKTPDKFGDLLLRLSEIAKTSTLCREMLNRADLPPEVSSFSLLMELLKTQPGL